MNDTIAKIKDTIEISAVNGGAVIVSAIILKSFDKNRVTSN